MLLIKSSQDEALLLRANQHTVRIRRSNPRWKKLEKQLRAAFEERRKLGRVVRRKWFERTSKRLFTEIYPFSTIEFCFSDGWFSRFLHRNDIALRIITNQAQETPAHHCEMIMNFLCFNRRNSQLRDSKDAVYAVGRYLTSNIVNMDQTPLPWEYLEGRTYEMKGNKTVWAKSQKSGWGKRQATMQFTIFADGVPRVLPLIIFRGLEESKTAVRRREALRYDTRVAVMFNSKAYATTATTLQWLSKQLLPALEGLPTLLIMDLLRSHKTKPVKKLLKKNDVTLSLVPAGCTGIVQPVDISFNRPFKDMLKEEIDKEFERADNIDPDDIMGSSAVGEMRVMMTRCVGQAWERFCREKREVIIRSFRCIGASLPIDGSSDGEISIKGLPTSSLMTALKDWKTRGAPTAEEGPASSSDDTSEDSSSSDDESDSESQPSVSVATRGKARARGVSGHGRAGGASRGRGRGKNKTPGHLVPSTTPAIGSDSLSTPSPTVPQAVALTAHRAAVPAVHHATAPGPQPAVPPAVGTRRSARLVGKPQRSHVISFPQITDTEGDEDEDEDGLEYDFRWHADEL